MAWTERTTTVQAGDAVAYSKQFLQSTGQHTGDTPLARGKVTALMPLGGLVLAEVAWDRDGLPSRVNVKNLSRVRGGAVMDRD